MLDGKGINIRRVENGYVAHEYSVDKDWAWHNIEELIPWRREKDAEIREIEQYDIYRQNAKKQQIAPMLFEEWKKNPIIAPIVSERGHGAGQEG